MRRTVTIRLLILLTGSVCAEAGIQLLPVPVQALGQEPSVVQLMASARTALEQGDLERARASLERVLAREGANKQARLALVDVLIRMARWADADSQARILTNQFPDETEPIYLSAQVALRRGDPASAIEFASRCLERGDNRSEIYKVLALAEYLLQRTEPKTTALSAMARLACSCFRGLPKEGVKRLTPITFTTTIVPC